MFNVGGMELVVLALVALVVLGPDKLPGALRQAGQAIGELRRMSQGFQADLRTALDEAEREAEREAAAARSAPDAPPLSPTAAALAPVEPAPTEPAAPLGDAPAPSAAAEAARAELAAMSIEEEGDRPAVAAPADSTAGSDAGSEPS